MNPSFQKLVAEIADARLKELRFTPCPPEIKAACAAAIAESIELSVATTLKNWGSVTAIINKAGLSQRGVPETKPVTPEQHAKPGK